MHKNHAETSYAYFVALFLAIVQLRNIVIRIDRLKWAGQSPCR
jgi:hypothetical protein